MDELDVRVDVFGPAVPVVRDRPETWPVVRMTHVPTGHVVEHSGASAITAKAEAWTELRLLVDGQSPGTATANTTT